MNTTTTHRVTTWAWVEACRMRLEAAARAEALRKALAQRQR